MDLASKLTDLMGLSQEPEVQHELLLRQVGNEWLAEVEGQKISPRAIMTAAQSVGLDRLRIDGGQRGYTIAESWQATDGSETVVDLYHVKGERIEPLKDKRGIDGLGSLYRWQVLRSLQGRSDGQDYSNSQRLADMVADPASFFSWIRKATGHDKPRMTQGATL